MDNYIKISIQLNDDSLSAILVAELNELGFEGFEEKPKWLDAFIPEKNFSGDATKAIAQNHGVAYTKTIIAPQNWNHEWEKNFEPVTVGDFCAVRASFHQPITNKKYEIIITPKMSFGTGLHATTWQMINAMSKIDFNEKKVLDFGTGTGVLAILAEKMGAEKILAIDNDDWSIENAMENFQKNNCKKTELIKADNIQDTGSFDIILANINKMIIIHAFDQFKQHLNPQGVLIISGILVSDLLDIENGSNKNGFYFFSKMEKDSWACISLKLRDPLTR